MKVAVEMGLDVLAYNFAGVIEHPRHLRLIEAKSAPLKAGSASKAQSRVTQIC
ncbi:hypothetical protein IVB55_00625 [Bradyrhizobium sp. CW4]|uniref:hypothetical protein n=1 Tax=Bradyrhizobium sp. CW4 TaxID=2782687 RepID=UPI001FFB10D5|nr:hypothetical protein [Bradyrhizobium sp. CW4]MCK1411611.1 hypothetical protein [Bradyrhizobium sp. CW4]